MGHKNPKPTLKLLFTHIQINYKLTKVTLTHGIGNSFIASNLMLKNEGFISFGFSTLQTQRKQDHSNNKNGQNQPFVNKQKIRGTMVLKNGTDKLAVPDGSS